MRYKVILSMIISISAFSIVKIINSYNSSNYYLPKTVQNNLNQKERIQPKSSNSKQLQITWDVLDNWEETSGNNFALATYKINDKVFDAEISITMFPGNAGGVKNNVNRWRRQLELPELDIESINKNAEIRSNSLGKFSIYKIINDQKPETAFLCMIQSSGDNTIFIKLKSTLNGINRLKNIFYNFCFSIRDKE